MELLKFPANWTEDVPEIFCPKVAELYPVRFGKIFDTFVLDLGRQIVNNYCVYCKLIKCLESIVDFLRSMCFGKHSLRALDCSTVLVLF